MGEDGEATEGSLLAFAAREIALNERLDDGSTQRDHATSYLRQTGKYPPGMDPVECPYELSYLWADWCSMNSRRTSSGFGPNPLSEEDMAAWARRWGIVLESFESDAIDALEALYMRSVAKAKKP